MLKTMLYWCSGQSVVEKVDEILQKIEKDQPISSYDIAMDLNINKKKTHLNCLHKAGYKKELYIWVPHELAVKNIMD